MRQINVLNKKYEGIGLDTPLSMLKGKTLKQIFEYANRISDPELNDASKWFVTGGTNPTIELHENGIKFTIYDVGTPYVRNTPNRAYQVNHKYYFNYHVTSNNNNAILNLGTTSFGVIFPTKNDTVTGIANDSSNGFILTAQASGTETFYIFIPSINTNNPQWIYLQHAYEIDMTSLNIEDLSQYDINYLHRIYMFLKFNEKESNYSYLPKGNSKYDVAYVNQTIDEVVYEGLSLKDIFETAQRFNGQISNPNLTKVGDEYIYQIEYTPQSPGIPLGFQFANKGQTEGRNYYFSYKMSIDHNLELIDTYLRTQNFNTVGFQTPLNERFVWKTGGGIAAATSTGTVSIQIRNHTNHSSISGTIKFRVKDEFMIDLSIFTVQPTKMQMDEWRNIYLARKQIEKKALTYADIFEKYNFFHKPREVSLYRLSKRTENYYFGSGGPTVSTVTIPSRNHYYCLNVKNVNIDDPHKVNSRIQPPFHPLNIRFSTLGKQSVIFNAEGTENTIYSFIDLGAPENDLQYVIFEQLAFIDLGYFDENITEEKLDEMLDYYLYTKSIVIYPKLYLSTDPTGFGNRYVFNELNKKTYGHELNFENVTINLLFGLYWNAYDGFNQLMKFISNNEAIIEYNYGKGERYTDVRLINAPKTEMEQGNIIRSKFDFKRLTPFYTILEGASLVVTNDHDWDLKLIVEGTVNTNTVFIEAENLESGSNQVVKFNFTSVTKPFNFYYNSETKQILINGVNNGYQYIDHNTGISFISVPKGEQHSLFTTGITNPKIKVKKWVID